MDSLLVNILHLLTFLLFLWTHVAAEEVVIDPENPEESRKLSYVEPVLVHLHSYAGYIEASERYGAYLFFWFFKSESNAPDAPLIVWLQGQHGLSCLNGLFEEHGPIYMDMKTYKIKKRDRAWTKKYHVLYLDQTIHCGYSFSLINETSSTLEETGIRIYHALRKFLLVFPEMQNRYLYLTGQFDSSKYITIACKENLATENPKSRMNIKGLMIGGGFTFEFENPNYDEIYHQFGLLDSSERDHMTQNIRLINSYVRSNNTHSALTAIGSLIVKQLSDRGFQTMLDARYTNPMKPNFASIIAAKASFRKMIHVGDHPFQNDMQFLSVNSLMRSTSNYLSEVLQHYKLLLYNGQFDLLSPYAHTQEFLARLEWDGCTDFYEAKRKMWTVNGNFLGYWTSAGNVTHVMIRNAGHMVGRTQPEALYQLLDQFVSGTFK